MPAGVRILLPSTAIESMGKSRGFSSVAAGASGSAAVCGTGFFDAGFFGVWASPGTAKARKTNQIRRAVSFVIAINLMIVEKYHVEWRRTSFSLVKMKTREAGLLFLTGGNVDNNVLIALIGSGSSGLVAITALLLNYRGFAAIDARFSSLESTFNSRFASVDARFASIERRLDLLQSDMKDLNKTMTALEVDVALVKDKVGL